ncbi:DsbA family protein [Ornithinimicrobium pratense]|uniref:Thioredoxin domain-containing protein n=1 Tax=Ornithinimicrobium pratense TaxID=2593973 RepID=A0A5J6V716_9MICO|nr:thioredoxin domain-containing protein [Ornithinimicrobium pratense]QFG69830.1 thioredoxin domain-containing protein [Ornithinimicrobium pratense]
MSTPTANQPAHDTKAASIAWAVAAIVVALVVAFIAWLAMGDRDGSDTAGDAPATTQEAQPQQTPGEGQDQGQAQGQGEGQTDDQAQPPSQAPAPDAAEQTPPPEIEEFMLGLQRRDADDPMAVGDVDAPVVMIEYADYRCPYCAQFATQTRPDLDPLVEDGTLRIEFRDLVLFEEASQLAAVAARAAAEQDHLHDYQTALFALSAEGRAEYDRDDIIALAEELDIPDLEAFETALDDPEILAAVQADTAEARAIGVTSTPTFLINTQVVQGAHPIQHFEQVIAAEAERAALTTR